MSESINVTSYLAAMWSRSGVRAGDMLLLHSNPARTARTLLKRKIRVSADDILQSFLEALGPTGTLLLPLFNFGFCAGKPFDIRTTPSEMGAVTEAARVRPEAVRTGHPVYSFAVIGRQAHRFENCVNYSGYGADSPFAVLRECGGRIAVLDLPDQHSVTFYHYVEEVLNVPYRYHKVFRGQYTSWDGVPNEREFGLFVRRTDMGVVTDVDRMGELLWEMQAYEGCRSGVDTGLRTIEACRLFDATAGIIRTGRAEEFLYRIQAE